MALASALSIAAHLGRVRAAGAGLLGGDRDGHGVCRCAADRLGHEGALLHRASRSRPGRRQPDAQGEPTSALRRLQRCVICERDYEGPDMAHCPAYQGPICSLCCTLDARCGDLCKPARPPVGAVVRGAALAAAAPQSGRYLDTGLGALPAADAGGGAAAGRGVRPAVPPGARRPGAGAGRRRLSLRPQAALRSGFLKAYVALLLIVRASWPGGWCWRTRAGRWRRKNRTARPQPADRARSNRTAAPTRRCRPPSSWPSRPCARPSRPTRPRAATSAPSATNCARRSTASWAMRS